VPIPNHWRNLVFLLPLSGMILMVGCGSNPATATAAVGHDGNAQGKITPPAVSAKAVKYSGPHR